MSKNVAKGSETTLEAPEDMEYVEECEDGFWLMLFFLAMFG